MFEKHYDYDILVPNFSLKNNVSEWSIEDTKKYFDWFLINIPERINYLKLRCSNDLNINIDKLDLSPNSLILVWKWFLKVAKIDKTPEKELKRIKEKHKHYPESFQNCILDGCSKKLNLITEYIVSDIAMYMSEVLIKKYSFLQWSFYTEPKDDVSVNKPVLIGFNNCPISKDPSYVMSFEPVHIVRVQASKIFDACQKENDLFNIFNIWVEFCKKK